MKLIKSIFLAFISRPHLMVHSHFARVTWLEDARVCRLFLKIQPLVLPRLVILLLHLSLVSEFKCLHFFAFLLSWFLSVLLCAPQVLWKFKFTNLGLLFFLCLFLGLLHIFCIILNLVWCNPNIIQGHDLLMIKLSEFDPETNLVASHISCRKLLCPSLIQSLFYLTFIPHASWWVDW